MKSYADPYWYWIRWVTDMLFYITVILLIMNMINGIIIATFSTIREEKETKDDDQEKLCFICGRSNVMFEEKKVDFEEHRNKKHNYKDFIRYFVALKFMDEKELDADQTYVVECMKNDDIAFFPVVKTSCLPEIEGNEE
jgi:hypothetical protein